ncbi:MAG: formate dehydrogenase accessory sulfurtransferase FdhD [Planctomycetia bacterium]
MDPRPPVEVVKTDAARVVPVGRVTDAAGPRRDAVDDCVAVEEPLEIRIGDEPLAVTMRTPGADVDLAAGFCLTEGIVDHPDDLERVEACALADYGNIVVVTLTEEVLARRREEIACSRRELYLSSSCGLCGKQTIDRLTRRLPRPIGDFSVACRTLWKLPDRMRSAQAAFDRTGGLHAAALFTPAGDLRLLREDVGRHNAVDKLVGAMLLAGGVPIDPGVLLLSGRASFEVVQKAVAAGVAVIAAVGAPSSAAVDAAVAFGVTLVGFLRPGRLNVYHDPGRLTVN